MKFKYEILSEEEAVQELTELRSGKGGRISKYQPLEELAEEKVDEDTVVRVELEKNEVGGLRGYLRRHHGEKYVVRSSRLPASKMYRAFIKLAE